MTDSIYSMNTSEEAADLAFPFSTDDAMSWTEIILTTAVGALAAGLIVWLAIAAARSF